MTPDVRDAALGPQGSCGPGEVLTLPRLTLLTGLISLLRSHLCAELDK